MSDEYDLIILGSGSTAFAAALRAQTLGARVLMIEKSIPGGTCINWGCVPSKTLIHDALFRHSTRMGEARGIGAGSGRIDFDLLTDHKEQVVQHLRQTHYLDVLQKVPNIALMRGTARFAAPDAVKVGEETIHSRRFLIATGGSPRIIDFPGLEKIPYLTSRTALLLKRFPESLIVVGGGVIAVELGQMFLRLGTRVTVLEHGSSILPQIEPEVSEAVRRILTGEGMEILTEISICSFTRREHGVTVLADRGGEGIELTAERVLLATGTTPASSGIGLDRAGVATDNRGFVQVDSRMRTTAAGIWAAGDVTGGMMIATVGAREGVIAVDDMFREGCGCEMEYLTVPMAVFTDPEIGLVGHTEASAREAGIDTMISLLPGSAIPKAHITGNTAGVIKMVADAATGRLLGVQLACDRGADVINEAALAIRCRLTVDDLAGALHVYPSMAEGLRLCAQNFRKDVSRLSCCAE
jgi:mercuric reductase